jgi:uncharacterized protein (UPF0276 family)
VPIDFLEVAPENYIGRGGGYARALSWLGERYPIVTHGLTLSVGGTDPLDAEYLRALARIVRDLGTPWHSDHLSFATARGRASHELLPVPRKLASVGRIAERIDAAREAIGLPVAVENVSAYWHPGRAELTEVDFLTRVCAAADCALLLDVNNVYVNSVSFGFDPEAWLNEAPLERVVQIHVAGHEWHRVDAADLGEACDARTPGAIPIDTHGAPVIPEVMRLLEVALERTGEVPVLLERDTNVPDHADLLDEMSLIRAALGRLGGGAPANDAALG